MTETQRSIMEWAEQTFGPFHPAVIASRMNVEVAELVSGLSTVARLEVSDIDPNTLDALREECADVGVMLFQVCEKLGVDLQTAINYKMAVNRYRSWARTDSGHFQHVDPLELPWVSVEERLPEPGTYLVTVETGSGPEVHTLELNKKGQWIHEGEPTFCHGYYFHPVAWAPRPAPSSLVSKEEA